MDFPKSSDRVAGKTEGTQHWFSALCFLLILAFLFTCLCLGVSRESGRLSSAPNYDDIRYLLRGSRALEIFQDQGLLRGSLAFLLMDLHSPFMVGLALLGMVLFGPEIAGIYLTLSLVVFTYLAMVWVFVRELPPGFRWGLVLIGIFIPFATLAAIEFRPDLMWGIVAGSCSVLWLAREDLFRQVRTGAIFGIVLGCLFLIKPSTFALTILVLGGSWLLGAVRALLIKKADLLTVLKSLGLSVAITLLISGWFWVLHGGQILNYFLIHSFGEYKDVWIRHGSIWNTTLFYFNGYALQSNMGWAAIPAGLLLLGGAISDVFSKHLPQKLRGFAFLWMIAGLAFIHTIFGMKQAYVGGALYGFWLFGGLWYLVGILKELPSWTQGRISLAAGAAAVLMAAFLYDYPAVGYFDPAFARNVKIANEAMRDHLERLVTEPKTTILLTHEGPVVPGNMEMGLAHKKLDLQIQCSAMEWTLESVFPYIEKADFVIVQDEGVVGAPGDGIPGEKTQTPTKQLLENDPRWTLAAPIPLPEGKCIYLFQRIGKAPVSQ